ncbi:MAG: DUF4170 domain-containing protein [Alphaproteobacteria bacterium]|nr:DUF4170 domain-containing protein [Alphaproteobacteria bacterium]
MAKQLLHLVFGGELSSLDKMELKDLSKTHFVGLFPNYAKAREAWKAAAQATVDNAHMRYFVVHLHRLLDPDQSAHDEATPTAAKTVPAKAPGRAPKAKAAERGGKPAKPKKRG